MILRTTPDFITELKDHEVFCFGSNENGVHGAGAAKQALNWGAQWGNPVGRQGQTYAIPTKDKTIKRTLSVEEIKPYVDEFIEYTKQHPDTIFFVTEIGTGLALRTYADMGPLFKDALELENVYLPLNFIINAN